MTPKIDGAPLDKKVLELLEREQVATAKYVAAMLGMTRQKAIWHLRRLAAQEAVHHAITITAGTRHIVWAAGATATLQPDEVKRLALIQIEGLRTRLTQLTGENAPHKTTWANGINPWTQEVQK